MITALLIAVTLSFSAYADDTWRCTESSSWREGNAFVICGEGSQIDLSSARHAALLRVREEFELLCSQSADCKGHAVLVEPLRTSCTARGDQIQCFRAVRYNVSKDLSDSKEPTLSYLTPLSKSQYLERTEEKLKGASVPDYRVKIENTNQRGTLERQIILSSIPAASEIGIVDDHGEERRLKAPSNPSTVLIHPSDKTIQIYTESSLYKSKRIVLKAEGETQEDTGTETIQVFLERK